MSEFDILDSVDLDKLETEFLSVSDRYYEHRYCVKFKKLEENLDHRVSFHSNRICMISLAESHPVIKCKKEITSVNCLVNKIDRLSNSATGKGKRGAQKLNPNSIICYIECADGTSYPVYSCVKGKLLEVNAQLITNPSLLITKPTSEGYIALVLPVLDLYESFKNSMLSKDEYLSTISSETSN